MLSRRFEQRGGGESISPHYRGGAVEEPEGSSRRRPKADDVRFLRRPTTLSVVKGTLSVPQNTKYRRDAQRPTNKTILHQRDFLFLLDNTHKGEHLKIRTNFVNKRSVKILLFEPVRRV